MNAFDGLVLVVVAVSALTAFARGIVRSLIAFVAWIVGLVVAVTYAPAVGAMLPALPAHPLAPVAVAFALIVVAALVAGALVAWPIRALIHGVGLGFLDRALGAVFGLARGVVIVLAFVLGAGLTTLPAAEWWQNSFLARLLSDVALELRPWLPPEIGERLDYSGRGGAPVTDRKPAGKA